jgi:hypothetical protein
MDSFTQIAELALALAGFAGVASAFGGRERLYEPVERLRLVSLFTAAGIVLAVSAFVDTMASAGVSGELIFRSASALVFVATAATLLPFNLRNGVQFVRDPSSSTTPWVLTLAIGNNAAVLILVGGNAALEGVAWPLIGGLYLLLMYGLWMFTRILTLRN